jgi:hypothetical protein
VVPLLAVLVLVTVAYRRLLAWRSLLAFIILVIWLVPIRRYQVPVKFVVQLEPYRLIVALVLLFWLTSLLIDRRVRLRGSVVDAPLLCFFAAIFASLFANPARVNAVNNESMKKLLFFVSFFLLFYLVLSVIRHWRDIDFVARVLVGGGAFVAIFALVESRTGYDIFDHLDTAIPYLRLANGAEIPDRGGRFRVFGSAQHPIALGAAFVLLIPLAVYLARSTRHRRWWLALLLLLLGALSTSSRTAITMLIAEALVFLWLRPREAKRLWPALLPALLVVHLAIPGAIGTFRELFFGGTLISEQNTPQGTGRLAVAGPALRTEFLPDPAFGEGFGTRVTRFTPGVVFEGKDGVARYINAPILDDEWLGTLIETGLFGAVSLAWLFIRFIRRAGRAAKEDDSARGWLFAGLAASVAAYATGMWTYDAFSFIQVTFLLFFILGLGCSALAAREEPVLSVARARAQPAVPTPGRAY